MKVVAVRFKKRFGTGYSPEEYHYLTELPLKVGQMVRVDTKYGPATAKVSNDRVDVRKIPPILKDCLKTITAECILNDETEENQISLLD